MSDGGVNLNGEWHWRVLGPRTVEDPRKIGEPDDSGMNSEMLIDFTLIKPEELPKTGALGRLSAVGDLWRGLVREILRPDPKQHPRDPKDVGVFYAQTFPGAVPSSTLITMAQADYAVQGLLAQDRRSQVLTLWNGVTTPEDPSVFGGVGVCNAGRWWLTFTLRRGK
jgi:hypothetical protein